MIDIDDRYAGRLALMLECVLIDYHEWRELAQRLVVVAGSVR